MSSVPINLSCWETLLSGIVMGAVAYSLSFFAVPIVHTITVLMFGKKSRISIIATAISQLAAGYLHTFASKSGMALSKFLVGGIYMAEPEMKNIRKHDEDIRSALRRFFCVNLINMLVINLMWETFTVAYLTQTSFLLWYTDHILLNITETSQQNETVLVEMDSYNEYRFIIISGITRFIAGGIAGMSTGVINQFWQRHQSTLREPKAKLVSRSDTSNKNPSEPDEWSPSNRENWIKVLTMMCGAVFTIISLTPNFTDIHLLHSSWKRLTTDLLVIHGGWLFFRDFLMIVLMREDTSQSSTPATPNESDATTRTPTVTAERTALIDQSISPTDESVTADA